MNDFFINYETLKLNVVSPEWTNLWIILGFFTIVAATGRRSAESSGPLLSVPHTDQLKGLAIFFVVLGHLWLHVSKINAQYLFSGHGVSLFLLLSGFGLAISNKKKQPGFTEFCMKRVKRVMIPYWFATILILLLDILILDKVLPVKDVVMTFLGINTRIELMHIDYARWFITFLLMWYFLFFLFFSNFRAVAAVGLLTAAAFILLSINFYYLHFGWYQFFPFPAGCLLGVYHEKLRNKFAAGNFLFMSVAVTGIGYLLIYKIAMADPTVTKMIADWVPNVFWVYISDFNSLIFCIVTVFILGKWVDKGFQSRALLFLGKYSFEIYLLHGAFLIKYNPIIRNNGSLAVTLQFLSFVLLIGGFSFLFYKAYHFLSWSGVKHSVYNRLHKVSE